MAFRHVLKSTLDPKIPLVEIRKFGGTEEAKAEAGKKWDTVYAKHSANNKEQTGIIPYLQINDYPIPEGDILEMTIDESGFIPTITVLILDGTGSFSTSQFPKSNMIASVYIKSPHDKLKPVRNDYLITSIRGNSELLIKGELFIPKMYNNVSNSYINLTSKDAIYEKCKELQIGFQSNETSPKDEMTWINPNWNSMEFLKHVISHSYQNDDSFFDGFIDKYYHLNYIDVNLQLEQDGEFDNTIFAGGIDYNISDDVTNDNSKIDDVQEISLLEHPRLGEFYGKIINRHLITSQGDILINDGYKKRIYYYDSELDKDDPMEKLIDFYVKPLSIQKNKTKNTTTLTPQNVDLKETEVKKWINIQYRNTHQQWNASKLINHHNNENIEKIQMIAKVKGFNFNVIRGMRIPVGIFQSRMNDAVEGAYNADIQVDESKKDEIIMDEYLSGIYYVSGNIYRYSPEMGIVTEHVLSKRNWKKQPVDPTKNKQLTTN